MKIALVSPYDYAHASGVNTHISRLRDNFTRMGNVVRIIAPSSKPSESMSDPDVLAYGRPIPIRASGSVVRSPVSPRLVFSSRIKEMLKRESFDVIHIHEPLMPTLATAVLHHASDEVMVGTFHASRARSWGYPFWKPICLQRWFDKLHGRVAVSQAALEFVHRYFPADYEIIPNGIDLPHFAGDVAPLEEFADGKLNILFVGRMEKRKGFKYLLGAYEKVKRQCPESRLIVVGPEGRAWRKYRDRAMRRGVKDAVFAGFVSYEDLPRYYKSAHVFCSPATDKESFGLVLLEAMAVGTPVVASRIAGYADVVSDGVDGLLVGPRDEGKLARGILTLLEDEALRKSMGASGKIKAADYGWESVAERIMSYYTRLMRGDQRAASEETPSAEQASARARAACQ